MTHESLLSARGSDHSSHHVSKHTARTDDATPALSTGSLATIVVFSTVFFLGGVAFIGLYLARRRARNSESKQEESSLDHSYHDVEDSTTTRRNKLQKKKKEWPLIFEATEIMSPIHHTAPPQIPPLFTKQTSFSSFFGKLSPTKSTKTTKSWKQTTWIDEENLHGPKMSDVRDVNGQPFSRDSWPLYTFTPPTMPTVTSEHVHPYYRGLYQQRQMTQAQIVASQPYITSAGPRQLPLPPRPALVTSNWVASTMGPPGGYYSLQDFVKHGPPPTTDVPQKTAPQSTQNRSQSRSRSHSRHRPSRQSSTDSVLSEILKSTEQRLADRSPSKTRPGTATSKSGDTSSRETLVARSDKLSEDTAFCQLCRCCSASPTKPNPNPDQPPLPATSAPSHQRGGSDSSAFGHKRGGSDSSAVSEPDSLIDTDFQIIPAGLTSPSRTPKSQGTPDHSPAASASSGLPTLYSESEAEEDKAHEGSPLRPTIYQRTTMARSMSRDRNDPFTSPAASPTRPTTSRGLPQPQFRSGLQAAKDATSPIALQTRYTAQLQEVAASSSPPQQSPQAAYLNLLPLDLYQLCTPPRQSIAVRSPTIVSADPDTQVQSVHPKKRMTGIFGTHSTPTSSPPPVPSLPKQPPSPTQQPAAARPKAYPPPHSLKPKGSSPTLGGHYPSRTSPTTTTTSTNSSPSGATPKGPRPLADNPPSSGNRTLLSTPIRGPTIRLRAASNTSQSSSVYSQDTATTFTFTPPVPTNPYPSPPVVSTVAALRRMNSAVSNVSGTSNASDGGGNGGGGGPGSATQSPTLPRLNRFGSGRGGGNVTGVRRGRHRRGNAGSRNYLGLLEVGKRGSKMDVLVWDEKGRDKENKKETGEEEEGEEKRGRTKEWRDSKDSLGLYDEDGFLISSPVRGGD